MSQITYIDAITSALDDALGADDKVFLYGQDIGSFGGAFKATKGLSGKYPGRVLDCPIAEDAMAGMALGAALEGMRPVIEMQFADFSSLALNQIINNCATHFYRTGIPAPVTFRLPSGGTPGSGPFHSQNMEALYAHYPGLIVLAPGTVADAYTLLREAIALDDPVVYCEHKFLYRSLKDERASDGTIGVDDRLPWHRARIARPGKHATVVTYSAMLHESLKAADQMADDGWQIEVVDLRCLKPLDHDTILASLARTGRILAVTETFPYGGVAAEVLAVAASRGFELLDAPPQRLTSRDTPIPYHPDLWRAHRPTALTIAGALRHLLTF